MSFFSRFWNSTRAWASAHKFFSALIVLSLVGGGYYVYVKKASASGETRYILGTVSSSTIIATVSASGQITASDQIDVKPKVTGEITWIGVKAGDHVRAGQAIATIDNAAAKQSVQQAEASLVTSKLQYQKDSAQAPIDFQKAQDDLVQAKQDLDDAYVDTFNKLSQVYLDLPAVMTGLQNGLYGYDMSSNRSQWNVDILINLFQDHDARSKVQSFADTAKNDYQRARADYDAALAAYKNTSRLSSEDTIDKLLEQSTNMSTEVAQAVQSELNLLNTASDQAQLHNISMPSYATTMVSNLRTYLSTTNADQSSLLSEKKSLQSAKQTIADDQHTIELLQVGNSNGANPISLQIAANNIASAEANLADLKSKLADYTIVSPFEGTIASVSAKLGDQSSAVIASVITKQQLAVLLMNEVDAAKIKVGQKATLTFDAIDDLTLAGKVAEIDTVGTVSQGVVSYTVKIAFDTFDDRVKTGMTVNANIITETAIDALSVPSSAVKTVNGQSMVQVFDSPLADSFSATGVVSSRAPISVPVVTGISDDTTVQILSGLTLDQQIVVRTATANATTPSAPPRTTTQGGAGARGGAGGGAFFRAL